MKAIKAVLEGTREIFRSENLDFDDSSQGDVERISFLQWLVAGETLPKPAVSVPPRRTSFLSWLLLPEKLPPPVETASRKRPSLISVLFGRETLPSDPKPSKGAREGVSRGGRQN